MIYINFCKCLFNNNTILNCVDLNFNYDFKTFFTWWNKQTLEHFLKTLFFGKYVGKDEFGNKYFKNKNDERWVIYKSDVEATKINTDWYLWMHHTVDKIPDEISKKINLNGKKSLRK